VGPGCRGEKGRGERGWAGPGVIWASWLPGAAQVGCWLFFFLLLSFSFVSDFCFVFFFENAKPIRFE
jgi:hypothetical protein